MEITYYKKWSFYVPVLLHVIFILVLTLCVARVLSSPVIPIYLIFSSIFLVGTLFSLINILRFRTGVFYYLLNIMFLLGFWFKYSVKQLTSHNLREPIGTFVFTPESEVRVLWVVIYGICGFIIAQVASYIFFEKQKFVPEIKKGVYLKQGLWILVFASVLSFLNLKFNFLLFGFKPGVSLPFKGNAIYFLALTRATLFLFFYYCLRSYSNKMLFLGSIVATICSVGVMSRMVVLIYFSAISIFMLQQISEWSFKKIIKNTIVYITVLFTFSYVTVFLSSGLRDLYATKIRDATSEVLQVASAPSKPNKPKDESLVPAPPVSSFDFQKQINNYLELALGRWIGIEGVMAVDSYPQKSFSFLWEALNEESYKGNSFYTRISNPEIPLNRNVSEVISTSVPGPVAFFYYSGSLFFVSFAMFASSFFLSFCEKTVFTFFKQNQAVGVFVSTFLVADFFQFGISPIAYLRYLSFSLFCVVAFYYIVEYKKIKLSLFQ